VAQRVAALAVDCPISIEAGSIPEDEDQHQSDSSRLDSYMMVHHNLHIRQQLYCDRFSEHVEYAEEWEKVIVFRVSTSLSHAEKLRRELDHYQSKVDQLQAYKSTAITKGKHIDPKLVEKLGRNEAKLNNSRAEYESYATDLTALMHEVTANSWKDLHQILLKMAQFDANLASDENQLLSNLTTVADNLKKVAHRYGLKPEARLKDLETLSAKVIVTDTEDKMGIDAESPKTDSNHQYLASSGSRNSGSSSKENDDAVVRDVARLLSKKGTEVSDDATPVTAHISGSSGSNRRNPSPSVIKKALNGNVVQKSPRSGSTSRRADREFSGRPQQINNQSSRSSRPPSRNTSRCVSSEKSTANPFDGLDALASGPTSPRNGTPFDVIDALLASVSVATPVTSHISGSNRRSPSPSVIKKTLNHGNLVQKSPRSGKPPKAYLHVTQIYGEGGERLQTSDDHDSKPSTSRSQHSASSTGPINPIRDEASPPVEVGTPVPKAMVSWYDTFFEKKY